jgi:signal transduction histidine kinase
MKLLTKTSLNFISASLFFFLFGSLGGYYFIRYSVNKYLNHQLYESKKLVDEQILQGENKIKLTFANVFLDTLEHTSPVNREPSLKDTAYVDKAGEMDLHRQLTYFVTSGGKQLRVQIRQSTAPTDLLVMKFTFMLATFPILFFCILYFVNRHAIKRSLSVFYDTINKLKSFDVDKNNQIQLMPSDIEEFEKLNEVFNAMEAKIKNDFIRLKEYTENTSHELQTPLAILSSKLEELIQGENLTSSQIQTIASLIETTNRLSRINQALIFLAKIDNRQFDQHDQVNINRLIDKMVEDLEFLWQDKNLTVDKNFGNELIVSVNQNLVHTLIQNLIKNAIRHNVPNGFIKFEISDNKVIISNSGEPLAFEPDEAFSRYKNRGHHLSMGIGLSIAKRISEISDIDIHYENKDTVHRISLIFKRAIKET